VVAELPGVGENLHDHPAAFVIYRAAQPVPAGLNNHGEALGLLRSDPSQDCPDLQILFMDISAVPRPPRAGRSPATRSRPR
jgi:choline dehydrogenase